MEFWVTPGPFLSRTLGGRVEGRWTQVLEVGDGWSGWGLFPLLFWEMKGIRSRFTEVGEGVPSELS